MPTQKPRRRVRDELVALAGFPPEGIREPFKPTELVWTQRFPMGTGGENHSVPTDSMAPDEAVGIINLRPTQGGLVPVWGNLEVGTPKASPTEVLNINLYKELDGTSRLIMIDEDDLRHWDSSSWTTVTGGGAAMTGTDTDRIRSAMVLNELVWVNGVDAPKAWQQGEANYSNLTADVNAPATARHVAAFADRVVFADIGVGASRNTQRLEWCASGASTDFTSVGAGGVTLYDTTSDAASDDIMALKVFDEFLVVFRQRSIWLGQRTGESAAPIRFHNVIQGTGTIAEDSVQVVGDTGIIFLGSDNVYLFHPNSRGLVPIGEPMKALLFKSEGNVDIGGVVGTVPFDTSRPHLVRSAYVPDTQCYHLFYPLTGDTWTTNSIVFDVGRYNNEERFVWHRRTYTEAGIDITAAFGGQTLGLGASYTRREHKLLIGSDLGEVFAADRSTTTDDGTAITWYFQSPDFSAGNRFVDVRRLNIAYSAASSVTGTTVQFYVNGTGGSTATYTFTDSVVNDLPIETAIHAPLGTYGRTVGFLLYNFVSAGSSLRLVGYRIGFNARGEILTTF